MKKHILLLLPIFFLALVCCNDNKTKDTHSPWGTVNVSYSITGGSDMTALFVLTAVYTDASGDEKREGILSLPWEKTIMNATMPFEANVSVEYTKRTDYPEKTSYQIGLNTGLTYKMSDGGHGSLLSQNTSNISNDKVAQYQDALLERTISTTHKIEAAE